MLQIDFNQLTDFEVPSAPPDIQRTKDYIYELKTRQILLWPFSLLLPVLVLSCLVMFSSCIVVFTQFRNPDLYSSVAAVQKDNLELHPGFGAEPHRPRVFSGHSIKAHKLK